jgi:hypothetical protein
LESRGSRGDSSGEVVSSAWSSFRTLLLLSTHDTDEVPDESATTFEKKTTQKTRPRPRNRLASRVIPTTTVQNVLNDDAEATNLTRTDDETTAKELKTSRKMKTQTKKKLQSLLQLLKKRQLFPTRISKFQFSNASSKKPYYSSTYRYSSTNPLP